MPSVLLRLKITRTKIAANLLQNMIESNSDTEVDGTRERARTHRVRSKIDVEHRLLFLTDKKNENGNHKYPYKIENQSIE